MKKILPLFFIYVLFIACQSEKKEQKDALSMEDYAHFEQQGQQIVAQSFQVLSQALTGAIAEGGAENAIDYCNINALSLTDSLSKLYNVEIGRTSEKIRNPFNTPDSTAKDMLLYYKKQQSKQNELKPAVVEMSNGQILFCKPILMQPTCLLCHGIENETLDPKAASKIAQKYPQDAAKGYREGDFRGIWTVRFSGKR